MLQKAEDQFIEMTKGAKILYVDIQNNKLALWAVVDPDKPIESIHIQLIGTGHSIEMENKNYIGTIIDGSFVWHIFEVK